jgi:hypothetical protein
MSVKVGGGAVVGSDTVAISGVGVPRGIVQAVMMKIIDNRRICFFMALSFRFYWILAGGLDDFGNRLVIEKPNAFCRTCEQDTHQSRAAQRLALPALGRGGRSRATGKRLGRGKFLLTAQDPQRQGLAVLGGSYDVVVDFPPATTSVIL